MPNISTTPPPPPPPRTRSLVLALLAAISAAVFLTISLAPVADAQSAETVTGRITARLLADGQIEFGWLTSVGARVLPRQRSLPADPPTGRWLRSSEVIVGGVDIGKVNVRVQNGRVEFGFTPRDGARILPGARYFPDEAEVGEWLVSPSITFTLGPPTVEEMEAAILNVLFGGERAQANYNDWGCPNTYGQPGIECSTSVWSAWELRHRRVSGTVPAGYQGGHSGWDAQTLSVAGSRTDNERFYAVSPGVIRRNGSPTYNVIAVWHEPSNTTTIYLHARSLNTNLRVGSRVQVGTWLGIQGDRGVPGKEHVHIEVRAGEWTVGSGGADPSLPGPTCNPVEFLWRSVRGWSTEGHECGNPRASQATTPGTTPSTTPGTTPSTTPGTTPSTTATTPPTTQPPPGELIRVEGALDVYEVKGNYRRLIVAGEIINLVPQWRWEDIRDVRQAEMNRYQVSRLVRLPNDDGKVYRVESAGSDSAVLRHIPDAAAFNRAGCEWDAVYDITEQEASFSGYSKGRAMPSSGWSC